MINSHLSSISHRFRDIALRKPRHPCLAPDQADPLQISESNLAGKEFRHRATFYWKQHDPSFSRFVTIHYRYRRQTTYYDNSRTLHCNGRLKTNSCGSKNIISPLLHIFWASRPQTPNPYDRRSMYGPKWHEFRSVSRLRIDFIAFTRCCWFHCLCIDVRVGESKQLITVPFFAVRGP